MNNQMNNQIVIVVCNSWTHLQNEFVASLLAMQDYFNAWSRNVFKNQVLKRLGCDWEAIMSRIGNIGIKDRVIAYPLQLLGKIVIQKWMESFLRIPGVIVGIYKK